MTLFIFIGILIVLSFLWALWSLRHEISKPKALKQIKDELAKEKILYQKS